MKIGVEHEEKIINYDLGFEIKQFSNTNSIQIDLGQAPSSSIFGQALIYNGNRQSMAVANLSATPQIAKIYGNVTFTISLSGSVFTINPSEQMWGITTVLFSKYPQ